MQVTHTETNRPITVTSEAAGPGYYKLVTGYMSYAGGVVKPGDVLVIPYYTPETLIRPENRVHKVIMLVANPSKVWVVERNPDIVLEPITSGTVTIEFN